MHNFVRAARRDAFLPHLAAQYLGHFKINEMRSMQGLAA